MFSVPLSSSNVADTSLRLFLPLLPELFLDFCVLGEDSFVIMATERQSLKVPKLSPPSIEFIGSDRVNYMYLNRTISYPSGMRT